MGDEVTDNDVSQLATSNIQNFQDWFGEMVRRYQQICADDLLRLRVCGILGRPFKDPVSRSRRYRIAALTGPALEEFLEFCFAAIPLQVQHVLGGVDRSESTLRSLPKGRVQAQQAFESGSEKYPTRRDWLYTKQRAIYLSCIVEPSDHVELYVGKAMGKSKSYNGLRGRANVYSQIRRKPSSVKVEHRTRHVDQLINQENKHFIRLGAIFQDDAPHNKCCTVEELLGMFTRSIAPVSDDFEGSVHVFPEQTRLIRWW